MELRQIVASQAPSVGGNPRPEREALTVVGQLRWDEEILVRGRHRDSDWLIMILCAVGGFATAGVFLSDGVTRSAVVAAVAYGTAWWLRRPRRRIVRGGGDVLDGGEWCPSCS